MAKRQQKAKTAKLKPPPEHDPSRKFYVSLFRQKPTSEMAIKWLCENGLGDIVLDLTKLQIAKKKQTE
jgi:hypothetical protein